MPRLSRAKIAVETGSDAAHERPSALGHAEGLALGLDEPVAGGFDKSLCFAEKRRGRGAVAAMELGGRERKITHQTLDHEGAHAIAFTSGGNWPPSALT
jgi:hypothetical protein